MRRRIPGAAGGRSVIDHAASTQSVIFNNKSMNTYMYDLRKKYAYDSLSDVGEIRVYQRADFQSGSRVLKKVF